MAEHKTLWVDEEEFPVKKRRGRVAKMDVA